MAWVEKALQDHPVSPPRHGQGCQQGEREGCIKSFIITSLEKKLLGFSIWQKTKDCLTNAIA